MERIIVVEDNLTFSGYVCRLLESKGFQTVSTSTCNPTLSSLRGRHVRV